MSEPERGDVLVLFGITGDLARKMILPALYRLTQRGELAVPVIGVALTDLDTPLPCAVGSWGPDAAATIGGARGWYPTTSGGRPGS